jgi:hypothetical protein
MTDLGERLAGLTPAKRQLLEQRLRSETRVAEPIAIVGMACRFPGAADLDAFWRLIRDGLDATGPIPSSRWDVDGLFDPTGEQPGKMSVRWAGLVDDVDKFDPLGVTQHLRQGPHLGRDTLFVRREGRLRIRFGRAIVVRFLRSAHRASPLFEKIKNDKTDYNFYNSLR